jgi:hypothetical protein
VQSVSANVQVNHPQVAATTMEPVQGGMANGPVAAVVTPRAAVPAQLARTAFEAHLREFTDVFQPAGHLERVLVRILARETAALETLGEGVAALQRQRARHLPELAVSLDAQERESEDLALAAAVSAPDVQLGEHLAQRHTRGFHRTLETLQRLQAQRIAREQATGHSPPPNGFLTEIACEEHLRKRLEKGIYQCPRCGCRRGHYIHVRRSWECGGCKRQTGLRAGTVAASSPVPLVIWFAAIRLLLWNPCMGTTELGMQLGINRATTVRSMTKRINAAMVAENSTGLLAGLDVYYARRPAAVPDSGVSEGAIAGSVCEGVEGHRDRK